MDSPESSVPVMADDQPSTGFRRRLIGAGLIGLAGSLVPRLAASAGATVPDTTVAATTTTAPPKRPEDGDIDLLGFAQSIELAASELYAIALRSGSLSDATLTVATEVHESHMAYGQSLNGLLGTKAPGQSSTDLIDAYADAFAGDQAAFTAAAYTLEDTLVATNTDLISLIRGTNGADLIASIIIVEARHALVFADLAGETDLDKLILTTAEALQPGEG